MLVGCAATVAVLAGGASVGMILRFYDDGGHRCRGRFGNARRQLAGAADQGYDGQNSQQRKGELVFRIHASLPFFPRWKIRSFGYPTSLGEEAPADFRYNSCIIKQKQYSTMTPSRNNPLEEKQLPKAQLLFAFLFGLVVLLAPAFVRSSEAVHPAGGGERAGAGRRRLRGLAGPSSAREKQRCIPSRPGVLPCSSGYTARRQSASWSRRSRSPQPRGKRWLGIASLAGGGLAAGAALLAILYALSQIV